MQVQTFEGRKAWTNGRAGNWAAPLAVMTLEQLTISPPHWGALIGKCDLGRRPTATVWLMEDIIKSQWLMPLFLLGGAFQPSSWPPDPAVHQQTERINISGGLFEACGHDALCRWPRSFLDYKHQNILRRASLGWGQTTGNYFSPLSHCWWRQQSGWKFPEWKNKNQS